MTAFQLVFSVLQVYSASPPPTTVLDRPYQKGRTILRSQLAPMLSLDPPAAIVDHRVVTGSVSEVGVVAEQLTIAPSTLRAASTQTRKCLEDSLL